MLNPTQHGWDFKSSLDHSSASWRSLHSAQHRPRHQWWPAPTAVVNPGEKWKRTVDLSCLSSLWTMFFLETNYIPKKNPQWVPSGNQTWQWKKNRSMEVWIGKSPINGSCSSTPCWMTPEDTQWWWFIGPAVSAGSRPLWLKPLGQLPGAKTHCYRFPEMVL